LLKEELVYLQQVDWAEAGLPGPTIAVDVQELQQLCKAVEEKIRCVCVFIIIIYYYYYYCSRCAGVAAAVQGSGGKDQVCVFICAHVCW